MNDHEMTEFEDYLRHLHASAQAEIAAVTDVAGELQAFKQRAYAEAAATATADAKGDDTPERAALVQTTDLLVRLTLREDTRMSAHTYHDVVRVLSGQRLGARRRYLVAILAVGFTLGITAVVIPWIISGDLRDVLKMAAVILTLSIGLAAFGAGWTTFLQSQKDRLSAERVKRTAFRYQLKGDSGVDACRFPVSLSSFVWFTTSPTIKTSQLPMELEYQQSGEDTVAPDEDADEEELPLPSPAYRVMVIRPRNMRRRRVSPMRLDGRDSRRPRRA